MVDKKITYCYTCDHFDKARKNCLLEIAGAYHYYDHCHRYLRRLVFWVLWVSGMAYRLDGGYQETYNGAGDLLIKKKEGLYKITIVGKRKPRIKGIPNNMFDSALSYCFRFSNCEISNIPNENDDREPDAHFLKKHISNIYKLKDNVKIKIIGTDNIPKKCDCLFYDRYLGCSFFNDKDTPYLMPRCLIKLQRPIKYLSIDSVKELPEDSYTEETSKDIIVSSLNLKAAKDYTKGVLALIRSQHHRLIKAMAEDAKCTREIDGYKYIILKNCVIGLYTKKS